NAEAEHAVRGILKKCHVEETSLEFFHQPTNRSWIRDYGPIFLKSQNGAPHGETAVSAWRFNAWAKYENFQLDARTPALLSRKLKLKSFGTGLVLEGGSIDVNGAGKLLTTEECLLSNI